MTQSNISSQLKTYILLLMNKVLHNNLKNTGKNEKMLTNLNN